MLNRPTENDDWRAHSAQYQLVITDEAGDSAYLRARGLQTSILQLLNGKTITKALDVGCGNGWLFDAIQPSNGCEVDIVQEVASGRRWPFVQSDLIDLPFPESTFDLVVASLVLMWIPDLQAACAELHRVAGPNATLIAAIMHPFGYRTGEVQENGDFLLKEAYGTPRLLPDLFIANKVGPFGYFHRPLSEYVNALITAGWSIERMREWSIDMHEYKERFRVDLSAPRRTDKLPLYALFECHWRSTQ